MPRLIALAVALVLVAAACVTVSEESEPDPSGAPATGSPGPGGTAETAEPAPSGTDAPAATPAGERIGYISLDERLPFARSVTASVLEAADAAGIEVIACDAGLTIEGALGCAERLGEAGILGLISFVGTPGVAEAICTVVGDVPTVGVAFSQGACEVATVRLDQAESGRLVGDAVGRWVADEWECRFDAFVSLEDGAAGADAVARMSGMREGFETHCRIPRRAVETLDGVGRFATAQARFARTLRDRTGDRIIVIGLNEDAVAGARAAVEAAGRAGDVIYGGQGADPAARPDIACDPRYIASAAHFPERYGEVLVPTLLAAIAGDEVTRTIDGPLELVSAADIRDHYPAIPACDG